MKKETLQKRWAKIRPNYKGIARSFGEQLSGEKPKEWRVSRGSGLFFCSNCDYTRDICAVLDALRIKYELRNKYELGNDAPRGGLPGNYIKILTKID